MKIITWNCNMAFRKKADPILAYQPDILVVQECECIEKLIFNTITQRPTDILWFGSNQHKGLAILSYGNYRLNVIEAHNQDLQIIVPVYVTNGGIDFNLLAVWAHNPNDPDGRYVEQVWKAIHHYDHLLSSSKTILAGDFNSNAIWDKEHRAGSHSDVVKRLREKGICSAYHLHHKQIQGDEKHPTFYLYRHQLKPYHLDYCFVSDDFANQIQSVEVGEHEFWKQYSDHVPLMVTFA
jgi:exodeoxyribonuclease III